MQLKILLPTEILLERSVVKVVAEAANGFFGLLPRHVDFATALVPGILYYTEPDGEERYAALDEGTLLKCGDEVRVSVLHGALGNDLAALQATVAHSFRALEQEELRARTALERLEAGALKRLFELERELHGTR